MQAWLKEILCSALRAAGYALVPNGHVTYDPEQYSLYDFRRKMVVPLEQAIYDPKVFGRYDLASQRVVSKFDHANLELSNYDVLMGEAQRYARVMPAKLENDRYTLAVSLLDPGKGICLDACTPSPLAWVRQRISDLGYDYLPIDINGDGVAVQQENLLKLNLANDSVSRILSLDTLEHIKEYKKALAELHRVLQEDGLAIFHVPCYYFEKPNSVTVNPDIDPWGHVRYFAAKELARSLAEAGFVILRLSYQFDYGAILCVAAKSSKTTCGYYGR